MSDDWLLYEPDEDAIRIIHNFDDGNKKYDVYVNEWLVCGEWRGKIKLVNRLDRTVVIPSISLWKTHDKII